MFKNILRIVKAVIVCTTIISFHCVCYAMTETHAIEIKCNKSLHDYEYWRKYMPDPKVTYSLKTIGVRAPSHGNNLVTTEWISDSIFVDVMARCFSCDDDGVNWIHMMGSDITNPPVNITCEKGQGLLVGMSSPVDQNPEAYKYYGLLTTERDDEKEKIETVINISKDTIVNSSVIYDVSDNIASLNNKKYWTLPNNAVSTLYGVIENMVSTRF